MPGVNQRRQARLGALEAPKLTSFLLEQWAWGYMSPQTIQRIASLARADIDSALAQKNIDLKQYDMLTTLGNEGSASNRMHGQLLSRVSGVQLPKPVA
eukprot:5736072-Pyramimonas_sp.AAC.1